MQSKGAIKLLAVLLGLACIFQLSFTLKTANVEKKAPRDWITEDGTYVTPEFVNYIRPLIQAELTAIMVDGLPRHLYYREND